jgi:hypothetical protein
MTPGRRRPPPAPAARRTAIVLYARVPRPGRVKTRLTPPLTPREACRLHAAFLADGARIVRAAARRAGADAWVAFGEPWEPRPRGSLAAALRGFGRRPQGRGDLGARMRGTCGDLIRRGYGGAIVVGADVPTLPVSRLIEACHALRRGADLVLGPARDGGYYLVGVKRDCPALFRGISWGTADVLRATLRRARRMRLRTRLLRLWDDVDRPEDLVRLARALRGRRRRRAPRSAALIALLARKGRFRG